MISGAAEMRYAGDKYSTNREWQETETNATLFPNIQPQLPTGVQTP